MLTDAACRNATCLADKPRVRFADAGGLYLEAAPNGSRRWFWKYRFATKERRMALGAYPEVALKAARQARDEARRTLAGGTDPVQARRVDRAASAADAASTFEVVARELHAAKTPTWSTTHAAQFLRALAKDAFPWIGTMPLPAITAPLLLEVLRRVEARGAVYTAHVLREYVGQVMRYGIATGRCKTNPAADLVGALKAHAVRHAAAVLEPAAVGELMRAIRDYKGHPATRAAAELSALLFQRPGNVRALEWAWIDADAGMLTIPAAAMKRRREAKLHGRPHLVPLASQSLAVLASIRPLTGSGRYVFPSLLSAKRPMSENTVRTALRRMGYERDEASAHGFRATARTLLVEKLNVDPEVVEAQLAHAKGGPLGSAYDRAQYVDERRRMMQAWADYLDRLRDGAPVVRLRAAS